MRKSRKLRVVLSRIVYRLRKMVERCFSKQESSRLFDIRYDKTADSFLGFVDIRLWRRHFST